MPSEVVYGDAHVDVRVSWGNEGTESIQIVSQAHTYGVNDGPLTTPTDQILKVVNDWLEAAKMAKIDVDELRRRLPFEPHFDGWWANLNSWSSVNRLISVLRRARDKAFGTPA